MTVPRVAHRNPGPQFGPFKPLIPGYRYRVKQNSNGDTLIAVFHGSKRVAHMDAYWAYSMRKFEEREEENRRRFRGPLCATDLRSLGAEGKNPNVLSVSHAFITDDAHKGKGIGRAMYQATMVEGFAVRESRIGGQPGPMFFVPDECGGAGNTSADARRVWASLAREYPSAGTSIRVDAPPVIGSRPAAAPVAAPSPAPATPYDALHAAAGDALRAWMDTHRGTLRVEIEAAEAASRDRVRVFLSNFYALRPALARFASVVPVKEKAQASQSRHPDASNEVVSGKDTIVLYPKFWTHDHDVQAFIFAHELGHWALSGPYGYTTARFIPLAAHAGIDVWDTASLPFAAGNMEEAFADAFASYYTDKDVFRRYPKWARLVETVAASGAGVPISVG